MVGFLPTMLIINAHILMNKFNHGGVVIWGLPKQLGLSIFSIERIAAQKDSKNIPSVLEMILIYDKIHLAVVTQDWSLEASLTVI
jgi:hypothetical protein